MNTKKMAKRLKDSGVSPVIATILMVAITVVLAAVLYVMVSGFTHSPGTAQSAGLTESSNATVAGNYVVTISSVSASNIPLSNLKIVISGAGTTNDGSFSYSSLPVTSSATSPGISFSILSGNGNTYLGVGDSINFAPSTAASSSLSGATITLYNGNTQLGTTTL